MATVLKYRFTKKCFILGALLRILPVASAAIHVRHAFQYSQFNHLVFMVKYYC